MADTTDTKPQDAAPVADASPTSAPAVAPVDLSKFDGLTEAQEKGIAIPILTPTGEPTGIVITVAGPDSDRQRKAVQKQVDERLRRRSNKPMTAAEMSESAVRMLASSVVGWNNVQIGEDTIPFSVDAAVSLFQRFPWIREQVDAVAGDRASFLKS